MGSIEKLGKKFIGIALFAAMSVTGAYANTLSEVQVDSNGTGYAVVFKTDSAAEMKKTVVSSDKMTIELKDIEAADELNTVYNVANVDNVTIQSNYKNGLKITLQGKGISNSKIYFENANAARTAVSSKAQNGNTIELSGPVSSYKPVYDPKKFEVKEEIAQTSNPKVNEILTKMNIDRATVISVKRMTKKIVNRVGEKNLAIGAGVFLLVLTMMFRPRKKKQPAIAVGLSSMRNPDINREVTLNNKLHAQNMSKRTIPSVNYGMKAYQQSQKNPYMTNNTADYATGISGIPRKPVITSKAAPQAAPQIVSPVIQTVQNPINNMAFENPSVPIAPKPNSVDSVKFLESITKIYEKNGRNDLAKGLKDNLKKAQMVKQAV